MLGEWTVEDYSIACMHAVDYRVVGGYNLSAVNFQFDLYQRHVASGLQVTIIIITKILVLSLRHHYHVCASVSQFSFSFFSHLFWKRNFGHK